MVIFDAARRPDAGVRLAALGLERVAVERVAVVRFAEAVRPLLAELVPRELVPRFAELVDFFVTGMPLWVQANGQTYSLHTNSGKLQETP